MLLISATPSAFARKVRIAMIEKGIPFELRNEVPWHSDTETPAFNVLEQLPILIPDDEEPVFESSYILEWLEARYPDPPLLPRDLQQMLEAKRVQVIAEGIMDATALLFFEQQREHPSLEWTKRQLRKVAGGLTELDRRVGDHEFFAGERFSLADVAVISVLGMQDVVEDIKAADHWRTIDPSMLPWQTKYPNLERFEMSLRNRPSIKSTAPFMFALTEKIV